jgi:hypothetical protein
MFLTSRKVIGFVVVLGSLSITAKAQFDIPRHELGVNAGMFVYLGDLTPEKAGAFKSPGFAVNAYYSYLLNRSFSLRTNLAIGGTSADDANYGHPAYRQHRALRFKARITELSELVVWNVTGNNYGDKGRLSPYIFAGAGISFLNIRRDWSRYNPEAMSSDSSFLAGLGQDTLHSLPRSAFVLPVGLGIRYNITSRLAITAEAAHRFMYTDYLDGFSKAANPDKNDNYTNYSLGVVYTLGTGRNGGSGSIKCPVIRN